MINTHLRVANYSLETFSDLSIASPFALFNISLSLQSRRTQDKREILLTG